ncbi:MAG: tryptophan--tRNA ligase [Bacilli bacterium]|nr:tryptophan--tRNA ligase [Bacilli bacterium]MDD4282312.1 tryptophan--tRNA ligase [Bacilli bacterium]MDD4718316.1 tryptophan--tRNA ligase [Bacilli bacterium]
MENKKNILTGIRTSGRLHLGHYFGAIINWVKLQEEFNSYFELADVQALTDNFNDPEKVRINTREVAIDLLSSGIDPAKATIFIQSLIPEIAELTVFYSNLVTVSRLYRNPTVKSELKQKADLFGSDGESVTYGFLGYPVSQAADITALDGDLVPVGEDQLPLVEQCREIVRKFNTIYGETLKEPKAYLSENPRIKGLDGNEKMGKSLNNAVFLSDNRETVSKKIMGAITDPNRIKKDDSGNPDICMVYYYHNLVNKKNLKIVNKECRAGTRGCVDCKKELIESMMEFLKPIQDKRKYYEENKELVDEILKEGTIKAKKKSEEVMKRVRKNMRIDYFS